MRLGLDVEDPGLTGVGEVYADGSFRLGGITVNAVDYCVCRGPFYDRVKLPNVDGPPYCRCVEFLTPESARRVQ